MPYLKFDADFPIDEDDATAFEESVAELYADLMDADTSYTAVAVRDDISLFLGRADDSRTVVCSAEIRKGRSTDHKRELALGIIDLVADTFDVPKSNQKVVLTEHDGHQMMGADRVGSEWSED